jgi:hypothetical protein
MAALEPLNPPAIGGLQAQLVAKAGAHARAAMQAYSADDWEVCATHAAVALELTAKAVLVSVHPTLIADFRDFDTVLFLSGRSAARTIHNIRTAGCDETLKRVVRIVPGLRPEPLRPILEARNGVMHLLGADRRVVNAAMAPWIHGMDELAASLGVTAEDVFGNHAETAANIGSQSLQESQIRVASKLIRAREVFEKRFGSLNASGRGAALAALDAAYQLTAYDETMIVCPACERQAKLIGHHEVAGWQVDYDDDGFPQSRWPEVYLYPEQLACLICGLQLDGQDELAAADIGLQIELEDVDASDFEEGTWDDFDD